MREEIVKELKNLVKENAELIYFNKTFKIYEVREKLLRKCLSLLEEKLGCSVSVSVEAKEFSDRFIAKVKLSTPLKSVESLGEAKKGETEAFLEVRIAERRGLKRALEALVSYNFIDESIEELIEEGKLRKEKKEREKKEPKKEVKKDLNEEITQVLEEEEEEASEELEKLLKELEEGQ